HWVHQETQYFPLTFHWDGSTWSAVNSPSPGSSRLNAVSAVSSADIWAAGTKDGPGSKILAVHWDGSRWARVAAPVVAAGLEGLRWFERNDVWGVGVRAGGDTSETFTMRWDGSSWSVVPSPSPGQLNWLHAVDGPSSDDLWAVGGWLNLDTGAWRTLTLHW